MSIAKAGSTPADELLWLGPEDRKHDVDQDFRVEAKGNLEPRGQCADRSTLCPHLGRMP